MMIGVKPSACTQGSRILLASKPNRKGPRGFNDSVLPMGEPWASRKEREGVRAGLNSQEGEGPGDRRGGLKSEREGRRWKEREGFRASAVCPSGE